MKTWLCSRFNVVDITILGLVFTGVNHIAFPSTRNLDVPLWMMGVSAVYMIVGGTWVILSDLQPRWQRVTAWSLVAASSFVGFMAIGSYNRSLLLALAVAASVQVWKASRGVESYRE